MEKKNKFWSFLKKLKTQLPHDGAVLLPGMYAKESKHSVVREKYF